GKAARFMSASFHFDAGPFSVTVELDDGGIRFRQKTLARERTEAVRWDQVSRATLVRPGPESDDGDQESERIARLFGAEALRKYGELHGKVGQFFLASRDERGRLRQMEIPAPLADPAFVGEFQSRLGSRWLGETRDRQQVESRLHTNPGLLKTVFLL